MAEKKLDAGEMVFREGDIAEFAYTIVSGKVELLEMSSGRESRLREVLPGQIFGDLALFDEKAMRQVTARAMESTVLNTTSPQEFKAMLEQCPKAVLPFLALAFEKMTVIKSKTKVAQAAVLESDVGKITVAPEGEKMKAQFKPMEVTANHLPFRIGGYPEGGELARRDQLHLNIASQINPLKVSRQHCEIVVENKSLFVTDLGSRFGTIVNNTPIGRGRGSYSAPLQKGANTVILGAKESPYKITVKCE